MNQDNIITTKFEFIAAKATLLARERYPWSRDIQNAAREIIREANDIIQLAREFEGGDR